MSTSRHQRSKKAQPEDLKPLHYRVPGDRGKPLMCSLYGGMAEQVRFLFQAKPLAGGGDGTAIGEAMGNVKDARERLVKAIAGPGADHNSRILHSQELIRYLWRADGGLGPYPLLDVLAANQPDHAYYRAYRDHLVHQVRVWLLGLYIIHRLPKVRTALVAEVAAEGDSSREEQLAEVLRRWKIAALWHDVGYVFEVQSAKESANFLDKAFESLNGAYAAPLAELFGSKVVPPERERQWQRQAGKTDPLRLWTPILHIDELLQDGDALWEMLAPAGRAAGLAGPTAPSGGLEPYLTLCRQGEFTPLGQGRDAFVDHGIAGAVLLLTLHDFICSYSSKLTRLLAKNPDWTNSAEQFPAVSQLASAALANAAGVRAAAKAVALHNIYPGLPNKNAADARGLTPDRYRIKLTGSDGKPIVPLAWLLAVADGLQDWDRPRFTAPRSPADLGATDQDLWVTADEDHLYLHYEMDETEAAKEFGKLRDELAKYVAGLVGDHAMLSNGLCAELSAPLPAEDESTHSTPAPECDLHAYLEAIVAECGTIALRGIMSGNKTQAAAEIPIHELYAPLQIAGDMSEEGLWRLLGPASGKRERGLGEPLVASVPGHSGMLEEPRGILLVGGPGSGKSTFLRMTAAQLARAQLGEPDALEHPVAQIFRTEDGSLPVPVFIRLSRFAEFITAPDRRDKAAVNCPTLLSDFLVAWTQGRSMGVTAEMIEYWLREGQAILLLDGLDEIPGSDLRQSVGAIVAAAMQTGSYGKCRFTLTSRPLVQEDYGVKLAAHELQGLSTAAIERFLGCWSAWACRSKGKNREETERYAKDLLEMVQRSPASIRQMIRNPLMLTCLAVIHWHEGRLPEQRVELYEAIASWLLKARHKHDEQGQQLTEIQRRTIFQSLALHMHNRRHGRESLIGLAEAVKAIMDHFSGNQDQRRAHARHFLECEMVYSGIIVPREKDMLQFWHLTLQEFFVADLLSGYTEDDWPSVLTNNRLLGPEWREVVVLLAGKLGNTKRTQALLKLILTVEKAKDWTAKAIAYALAMAVIGDLRSLVFRAESTPGAGRNLREDLDRLFTEKDEELSSSINKLEREVMETLFTEKGQKVPLKVRVSAAEALGRFNDPRLEEKNRERNWVCIDPEKELEIGVYPVTIAEFTGFVEAGGYDSSQPAGAWVPAWKQAALEATTNERSFEMYSEDFRKQLRKSCAADQTRVAPESWEEQLATPNRPVVSLTWYEAAAYCEWLSKIQNDGREYRLLTAAEWVLAAGGPNHDRTYPWGNEPPGKGDLARANYDGAGIGHPTPVGLFPTGAARWGIDALIHDLAGNVWEWCSDEVDAQGNPQGGGLLRALRGGGWVIVGNALRVDDRLRDDAVSRLGSFGFRVCRARRRC